LAYGKASSKWPKEEKKTLEHRIKQLEPGVLDKVQFTEDMNVDVPR
jgi:hypothetical protein